jgi:outer membrane protein insertion porin family
LLARSLLMLSLVPGAVPRALAVETTLPDVSSFYGQKIADVRIEGVTWANDLRVLIRGAVRVNEPLTLDGLQRAIRALQGSSNAGRRLSRVTTIAQPSPKGVELLFVVEPLRKITRFTFRHSPSLNEAQLLRAANVPAGTEFWPDTLRDATRRIAEEYFRAGWRDAAVKWEAQPSTTNEDVTVALDIDEGQPTTLVQLEFPGDKGLTDAELFAAFNLLPGDRLSMDTLDEGLTELRTRYRNRQYYLASVGQPKVDAADGRAVVEIPVAAGPRFRLQTRGNRTFDESLLISKLRYNGDDPLDAAVQRTLAERIQMFYLAAGYPFARVVARENRRVGTDGSDAGEVLVTFLITEGAAVRVTEKRFDGLHVLPKDELIRRIDVALEDSTPPELTSGLDDAQYQAVGTSGTTLPARARPRVTPSEVFSPAAYQEACTQIENVYKSQGFLEAHVGPAQLELIAPGRGRAVIPVEEGLRTRVRAVSVRKRSEFDHAPGEEDDDADYLPLSKTQPVLTVHEGDPVSFFAVEESRAKLLDLYRNTGHLFAEVDDREEDVGPSNGENGMNVIFTVKAGKQVHVGGFEIKGIVHTDPSLVRNALTLKEGDVVTPAGLQACIQNLLRLNIFSAAAVDIADPERAEDPKMLVVQLREKPIFSLELKAGVSLVDGPRVSAQFQAANLGGHNRSLSVTAKFNYPYFRYHGLFVSSDCGASCNAPRDPLERSISVTFAAPIYREGEVPPVDQHYDLVHENTDRPAYQLRRYAIVGTFDKLGWTRWGNPWTTRLGPIEISGLLQFDVENDLFKLNNNAAAGPLTVSDRKALLLPEGEISLFSIRPTLTIDGRDDKLSPTSGVYLSLGLDFSKSILEGVNKVQLLRGIVQLNGYLPVSKARRIVIAVSGRMGAIESAAGAQVIGTKRFFLGGTGSLRGFNEDGLVPDDQRRTLHDSLNRCHALVSGATCGRDAQGNALSPDLLAIANGTGVSTGGNYMVLARAELRFGLTESLDAGLFVDAGNLWVDPSKVNFTSLRYAAGTGLRFPLPIGPAALDFGFNVNPDTVLGEPLFRIHVSIGLF